MIILWKMFSQQEKWMQEENESKTLFSRNKTLYILRTKLKQATACSNDNYSSSFGPSFPFHNLAEMSGAAIWAFHSNVSEKWERSRNLYFWIQHTLEHLYHKEAIQIEERERKIRRNRLLGFRLRVDSREVSGGDVCIWSCGGGIFWKSFYSFLE